MIYIYVTISKYMLNDQPSNSKNTYHLIETSGYLTMCFLFNIGHLHYANVFNMSSIPDMYSLLCVIIIHRANYAISWHLSKQRW